MIAIGLAIRLVAIAWPGGSILGVLLGAVMVAYWVFGLMTES